MRSANLIAMGLLVLFVTLAHAADKTTPPPPDKKTPPPKAYLNSVDPVEGKTLAQWADCLLDGDPSVREKAISVIPIYGPSATPYIPQLIACLDPKTKMGEDLGPRLKAIVALGLMEIPDSEKTHVVIALANRLEHDEQQSARFAAAVALTRFGDEGKVAVPALISGVLDRASWQIRKVSIRALRRIGGDKNNGPNARVTGTLSIALHDPAFEVRVEAAQALGYIGRPRDTLQLGRELSALKLLTNVNENSSEHDKILAMWAHVSIMALDKVTEEQIKHITKHLDSTTLTVRGEALLCIGTLGKTAKSAVPDVLKMLKDKDLMILACWTLAFIGEDTPRVIDGMNEAADRKDNSEAVRKEVKTAIEFLKNRKKMELETPKPGDKPADKQNPKR